MMAGKAKMPVIGARLSNGDVRDLQDPTRVESGVSEAKRLQLTMAAIRAGATPPDEVGGMIPAAPARGRLETFVPHSLYLDLEGNPVEERGGYRGRSGARVRDVFDEMTDQAARRHRARGKAAGPFVPPFTTGQVSIARAYVALTERCNSSGVKCSSLETLRQAASGGGDREAAIFRDFAQLRAFHRRIGDQPAKEVRRIRPSASTAAGRTREAIMTRLLVDRVCLGDQSLTTILRAHGWTADANQINQLRAALCAALDRMQGYRDTGPQNMP